MNTNLLKMLKLLMLAALMYLPACQATEQYEMITIPEMLYPLSMTDDASTVVGMTAGSEAIIWQAGKGITILGEGVCWGVSDGGKVTGELRNPDGLMEAFIWENGTITFQGNVPNGSTCDDLLSTGLGISRDGSTIIGMGWRANWSAEAFFKKMTAPMVPLGQDGGNSSKAQAVNGNGTLFGGWNEADNGGRMGAMWNEAGTLTYLPSFDQDYPYGEVTRINRTGTKAVGFCVGPAEPVMIDEAAYIWTPAGGLQNLGVPANGNMIQKSIALDVSENDVVIGQYWWDGFTDTRACIRTPETGLMVDFKSYLTNLGLPGLDGWTFFKGHLVSANGKIFSGMGVTPNQELATFVIKLSEQGTISGQLTVNGGSGVPTNAVIKIGSKFIHPDASGFYTTQVLGGVHQISATLFGYNNAAISDVVVTSGQTTANVNLTINQAPEPINQISNLTVGENNGLMQWQAPMAGFDSYLAYDNGVNVDAVGSIDGGMFGIASRWPVETIRNYSGAKLKEVRFFPRNNSCTFKVKVWKGINVAETLIYEKELTGVVANEWNTATIDQTLLIDGTQDLFYGIEFGPSNTAARPAGYGEGPSTPNCSDLLYDAMGWISLGNYGMELNWNLQALVTDSNGKTITMPRPTVKENRVAGMLENRNDMFSRFNKPLRPTKYAGRIDNYSTSGVKVENKTADRPVQSYKIFLNNQVAASNIAATQYQLTGLTPNTSYTVGVSAVYANGSESVPVNKSFIFQQASEHLNPVDVAVNANNIVSWGLPAKWFGFCTDESADAIGDPDGDFAAAIRFTPEQLTDFANTKLTKISFYPRSTSSTYTLKIWSGANGETELHSQPITNVTADQWNEVTLTTPVAIDVTKELFVGYVVSGQVTGENSAGTDAGPAVIGHGDMVKMINQGWTELADWGLNKNWNLRAYIQVQSGKIAELKATPAGNINNKPNGKSALVNSNIAAKNGSKAQNLTGYNVYLNNMTTPVATVTTTTYQLTNLNPSNTVGIQAVYTDGVSDIITKSFTGISDGLLPAVTELKGNYPNPFNPATIINFSVANSENIKIAVYNVSGQLVKELLNSKIAAGNHQITFVASALNSGLYYAVMESASGVKMTQKMMLLK